MIIAAVGRPGAIPDCRCRAILKRKDARKCGRYPLRVGRVVPAQGVRGVAMAIGVFSPTVTYKTEPHPRVRRDVLTRVGMLHTLYHDG